MNITRKVLLLGQALPTTIKDAARIKVKKQVLDPYLNIFFREVEMYYAHDPDKKCKDGDIVLIEQLDDKLTRKITHKILKVVYPHGDITDPISGKKVVVDQYREDIEKMREFFGKKGFEYNEAPPRGWQEGKRDFTHQLRPQKFNEGEHEYDVPKI